MQPIFDIQSRQQEESRIVLKWLDRLHDCLLDEFPGLFETAVSRAYISEHQMRKGDDLSLEQFDRVMEYLRRKVLDIYFRFFSELELLDLGVLGYAVLSCSTLKQGLSMLFRYVELTTDRFTEVHLVENGVHVIRVAPTWRHLGQDESIAEDCLGGNWRAIRILLGSDMNFHEAEVFFSYPAPENISSYEAFFSPCRVHFGAENSELRIPVDWLEFPINSGHESLSDMTAAMCERLLGPGNSVQMDTPRSVRRLLLSRPGKRMLRLQEAADTMAMSTAQLRKRLYRAGTSYKSIVLEVRMGLARHYLETTHLSIQEIAFLLDYAQPGPFSRAFKKYYGDSPRTVRNRSLKNAQTSVGPLHAV